MPRLVGIAEIAVLLQVSRQRADQLTRTRSFPEPVRRVAPLDHNTTEVIRQRYDEVGTMSFEQAIKVLEELAYDIPLTPRLWRVCEVQLWAQAEGRLEPGTDGANATRAEGSGGS